MKSIAIVSAAALVFAAGFAAQAANAATEVELRYIAARVNVIPENRPDVDLKVAYGKAKVPVVMVHTEGNRLVADGKLGHHDIDCRSGGMVNVPGVGEVAMADLPLVTIRVPMDAQVSAGGATFGQVGNSKTLELDQGGCGNWTVGDVVGKSEINIGGSGDVTGGNMGELEVNIGGSGSFKGNNVGHVEANIGGHGDITLASVNGTAEVNIGGSGNVIVNGGQTGRLETNIAGSGDVRFNGTAKDVEVNIVGSGDVRIHKVTGSVNKSIMGSGTVIIGQ